MLRWIQKIGTKHKNLNTLILKTYEKYKNKIPSDYLIFEHKKYCMHLQFDRVQAFCTDISFFSFLFLFHYSQMDFNSLNFVRIFIASICRYVYCVSIAKSIQIPFVQQIIIFIVFVGILILSNRPSIFVSLCYVLQLDYYFKRKNIGIGMDCIV